MARQEVSALTLDKDMESLKSRVNQMYFGILVMENNLEANMYMDTLLEANLRTAESAAANGTALQSDIDNIKVELLTLRQQRKQLESWGEFPLLVERAAVDVVLELPGRWKVEALQADGAVRGPVSTVNRDGKLCFQAATTLQQGGVLCYHLSRQKP